MHAWQLMGTGSVKRKEGGWWSALSGWLCTRELAGVVHAYASVSGWCCARMCKRAGLVLCTHMQAYAELVLCMHMQACWSCARICKRAGLVLCMHMQECRACARMCKCVGPVLCTHMQACQAGYRATVFILGRRHFPERCPPGPLLPMPPC